MKEIHERELQKSVHSVLSDPSVIRAAVSGRRLQVLSPGRINVHPGPDFREIAVLLGGIILVGDAEFHRNSSDWFAHGHDKDAEYNSVILHIILNDDARITLPFETLILNKVELRAEMSKEKSGTIPDINSLHDLQDYALIRLLRKTSDAKKVMDYSELTESVRIITAKFLENYFRKKRRPVYDDFKFKEIIQKLTESEIYNFLVSMKDDKEISVNEIIPKLLKEKIANEGSSLRQEILLNCIIPIAINLANEENRISLFLWFWSTPAMNKYGVLKRRFKDFPQNYIWQQQGMLEYIKEFGRKQNIISDVVKSYGFGEVLEFYKIGRQPLD